MDIENLTPIEREHLIKKLVNSVESNSQINKISPDIEERYESYPMSDVQKSYWVENKGGLRFNRRLSNIYADINIAKSGRILTYFLKKRIEKAVSSLCAQHDILKTIILENFQQQTVKNDLLYHVKLVKQLHCKRTSAILDQQKEELIYNKIDCGEWPLFKIIITQWKEAIDIQMGISPLLMDGDGVALFLSQLVQGVVGIQSAVDSSSLTYRDYVMYFIKQKRSKAYKKAKLNKLNRLEQLPPMPNLPLKNIELYDDEQEFQIDKFVLLTSEEWSSFQTKIAEKQVTAPAVLLTLFTDAVATRSKTAAFYIGMINTYHLPELDYLDAKILGNFNTIDFIEIDPSITTFYERATNISKQFTFNYDNGRYSGFEEIRKLRVQRQLGNAVTFPVGFNCTINIPHPSTNEVLYSDQFLVNLLKKYMPQVKLEELNIYTTQLPFIPTIELGEKGELICKFARYSNYFQDGVLEDIMEMFKNSSQNFINDGNYWDYSVADVQEKIRRDKTKVSGKNENEKLESILNKLRKLHYEICYFDDENIDDLYLFGMDSVQLIQFCTYINKEFQAALSPNNLLLDGNNLNKLAKYLLLKGASSKCKKNFH